MSNAGLLTDHCIFISLMFVMNMSNRKLHSQTVRLSTYLTPRPHEIRKCILKLLFGNTKIITKIIIWYY